MDILALTPVYADVLAELHDKSFPRPWGASEFLTLLQSPGVFGGLAVDTDGEQDMPVGFCLCRAVLDEAELLTICVRPESRGCGIARALLSQSLSEAEQRDVQQMFLEVSVHNLVARALYAGNGFVSNGMRPGYYLEVLDGVDRRIDAEVMVKHFSVGP